MKITLDVPNQRVTLDGIARSVIGLMPEYADVDGIEFDVAGSEGVITYKSATLAPARITSIATLQGAISRWNDAKPSHASVWLDIKAKREALSLGGIFVSGNWFFTDTKTVGEYSIMLGTVAVHSLPNAYVFSPEWKTMTGKKVPMTAGLLKAIVFAGIRNAIANHANAERHRALMGLTSRPGSYNFYSGWTREFEPSPVGITAAA